MGGRPGSGKSTLAQMLVIQTAVRYNEPVLVVSAEMDVETFTNRCISALTKIPYDNIHNAELFDGMLAPVQMLKDDSVLCQSISKTSKSRQLQKYILGLVKRNVSTRNLAVS